MRVYRIATIISMCKSLYWQCCGCSVSGIRYLREYTSACRCLSGHRHARLITRILFICARTCSLPKPLYTAKLFYSGTSLHNGTSIASSPASLLLHFILWPLESRKTLSSFSFKVFIYIYVSYPLPSSCRIINVHVLVLSNSGHFQIVKTA